MTEKEKYIGQSKLLGNPEKPMRFKLGKGVVKTDNIADEAVTTQKVGNYAITSSKIADGAVTAQKIADGAISIDKIADGTLDGKEIVLNSNLIAVKMEGNKIVACYGKTHGEKLKLERAKLYILIREEYDPVDMDFYWLGAGKNSLDVMNDEHQIPITSTMRGAFNIEFNQDDYLYIIIPVEFEKQFIRADLNSVEIPFDKIYITLDDEEYCVFRSVNKYPEGILNIDING